MNSRGMGALNLNHHNYRKQKNFDRNRQQLAFHKKMLSKEEIGKPI
jgi:hypothetical protein